MILCVGAASRRVVEEAARLRVDQVVASRRQVGETSPGYTGYTGAALVEAVRDLSAGFTHVIRDHGGPYQNGDKDDDWVRALDVDVAAGFDGLHLDVCQLPPGEQPAELTRLCKRYAGKVYIEVGGERDSQDRLNELLKVALTACQPYAAVADLGGRIWADRQYGSLVKSEWARWDTAGYRASGVKVKAHNCDWIGGRESYDLEGYYNVAPEFGNVEADAWLHVLPHEAGARVLSFAYGTGAWKRWFGDGEGTRFERGRAALRYHLNSPEVDSILSRYDDTYVREVIRDAITAG